MATRVETEQANLKQLLERIKSGQEVVLVQNGRPVARLTPYIQPDTAVTTRRSGQTSGTAVRPTFFTAVHNDDMDREIAAYEAQYTGLVASYLGQYVAFYQGELVDHDQDQVALLKRIDGRFPSAIVLIRQVQPTLPGPIQIRSPHLVESA
jgi:prevent-host-death family protein